MAGDDQCARRGIEILRPLENFHGATGARQKRRGEKTASGSADDGDSTSGPTYLFDLLLQNDLPVPQILIVSLAAHQGGSALQGELQFPASAGRGLSPALIRSGIAPAILTRPYPERQPTKIKQYSQTSALGKA